VPSVNFCAFATGSITGGTLLSQPAISTLQNIKNNVLNLLIRALVAERKKLSHRRLAT
jgi:hypothetical protein